MGILGGLDLRALRECGTSKGERETGEEKKRRRDVLLRSSLIKVSCICDVRHLTTDNRRASRSTPANRGIST